MRLLRKQLPWAASLRDISVEAFEPLKGGLPKVIANRCEHVIRENERVRAVVRALRSCALHEIGPLFAGSHISLRDLYEVSSPELDALVEIASGSDPSPDSY